MADPVSEPVDLALNEANGPWCGCGNPRGHPVRNVDCDPVSEPVEPCPLCDVPHDPDTGHSLGEYAAVGIVPPWLMRPDDPGEREAEKERLAQALRDGDMATFTAAVRKVNRPMSTRDIEHERRRMAKDLGSPDPVSEPVEYPGQHDDCIATVPHFHDRPYRIGDWGPVSEPVDGLRALLTFPCDCVDDWTKRGRHAPDCRYQFIHDFLSDEDIASVLAAAPAEDRGVDVEALRGWFMERGWSICMDDDPGQPLDPFVDLAARQSGDPR